MIYGVGTDILEVSRIEKSLKLNRFVKRVFSSLEYELFEKKKMNPQTIAANFCGKEAFFKAVGTGIQFSEMNKVSVLRNENGKPYIHLEGKLAKKYENIDFYISLSHTEEYAVAFVTAEKRSVL